VVKRRAGATTRRFATTLRRIAGKSGWLSSYEDD
jgi:hypothetical protein